MMRRLVFALPVLFVRVSRLETQMSTLKESLDALKAKQADYIDKTQAALDRALNGETVTDEERAEIQEMGDALNAAAGKLPAAVATPSGVATPVASVPDPVGTAVASAPATSDTESEETTPTQSVGTSTATGFQTLNG